MDSAYRHSKTGSSAKSVCIKGWRGKSGVRRRDPARCCRAKSHWVTSWPSVSMSRPI